jgi:hypothetical protein
MPRSAWPSCRDRDYVAWGWEPAVSRMTSPVVFGINSSAARGLNVPGTAALTEPDHLPVPSWVDRTAGLGGKRVWL